MKERYIYNKEDLAARIIINYSYKKGELITNVKLQKLLFYTHIKFLKMNKEHFNENFVYGRQGPVLPGVYDKYKIFAIDPIPKNHIPKSFFVDQFEKGFNFNYEELPVKIYEDWINEDLKLIHHVVEEYLGIDGWELVKESHQKLEEFNFKHGQILNNDMLKKIYL